MRELFECEGDLPVRPRAEYAGLRIVFNALPRDAASLERNKTLKIYSRLSDAEYARLVRSSRVFLCTRSPADLVSPRLFECLASGTRVIAERNPAHAAVFPHGTLEEFDDAEGFADVLASLRRAGLSEGESDRLRIAALVRERHTWQARVAELLQMLEAPVRA
jgi:glycosyltransferase involved in cell wall biosynthesis